MKRRTWAQIDLDALRHNFELAKKLSGRRVMPVIKADAYGHGAVMCARELKAAGADCFAVACLDEAIELRRAGFGELLLILGYTDPDDFGSLIENDITQNVMSLEYAKTLSDFALAHARRASAQIKLDTGMARLGIIARGEADVESAAQTAAGICALKGLEVGGIFTHFATSDIPKDGFTDKQAALFADVVRRTEELGAVLPVKHCANSGSIVNHPEIAWDMVREGIILYGEKPDAACPDMDFRTVMSLRSSVSFLSALRAGETVSYGRTFTAAHDMRLAVIPVGYADGYSRALSNRGRVVIRGVSCPIVGRVCMDQLMVDASALKDVRIGDEVLLFGGEGAPALSELAEICGTINYELLCAVGARVPRVYIRDGKTIAETSRILS